jgi:hypothetical protein
MEPPLATDDIAVPHCGPLTERNANPVWFVVGKDTAMNIKEKICAGLLAILMAAAQLQPGLGAERGTPLKSTAPVAKVSEEQATKIALERIPGKVTDVAIERKRGKNVYVVEIRTPDGGEKDVFVDIESGQIVGTE